MPPPDLLSWPLLSAGAAAARQDHVKVMAAERSGEPAGEDDADDDEASESAEGEESEDFEAPADGKEDDDDRHNDYEEASSLRTQRKRSSLNKIVLVWLLIILISQTINKHIDLFCLNRVSILVKGKLSLYYIIQGFELFYT